MLSGNDACHLPGQIFRIDIARPQLHGIGCAFNDFENIRVADERVISRLRVDPSRPVEASETRCRLKKLEVMRYGNSCIGRYPRTRIRRRPSRLRPVPGGAGSRLNWHNRQKTKQPTSIVSSSKQAVELILFTDRPLINPLTGVLLIGIFMDLIFFQKRINKTSRS